MNGVFAFLDHSNIFHEAQHLAEERNDYPHPDKR